MNKVLAIYIRVVLAIFPIFFLPIVIDSFGLGKNWYVEVTALLGMVIWIGGLLVLKENEVKWSRALTIWTLVVIWELFGWWRMGAGVRERVLVMPFGLLTWAAMGCWLFLETQVGDKEEYERQFNWLTAGSLVAAVAAIVVFLIPAGKLPIIWPRDRSVVTITANWSFLGSLLAEAVWWGVVLIGWLKRLLSKISGKAEGGYVVEAALTGVLALSLFLAVFKISKASLGILDWGTAWSVAAEAFKRSPIRGVGVGNFIEAFNLYRPLGYNLGQNWANIFGYSAAGILQIWTELGLVGLALVLWLVAGWWQKKKRDGDFWWLGAGLAVWLLLPYTLTGWLMVVWLLASRKAETGKGRMVLKVGEKGWNVMPAAVAVVVVAGVGLVGREIGREILGERYMKKSIVAAGKNDAKGTYDWQIRAITMNPTMADYRKVYAQTNLSIAQGLLSAPELSDEQKQQAAMLVQQAVREGKTAVNLEPLEPKYWLNLAEIYRGLIGLVDGAAEWSYQAYAQAVGLDGVNPLARLQLGGLLYSAGRWEEADRVFELVVSTKGDFANGWYNWAYSAKQLKKLPEAIQRLGQALSLVPVDSADYDKASQELGEWKKELEEINKKLAVTPTPTGKAGVLKTAEPLPTGAKEKVEVPKTGLEPPAGEATPTP